MNRAMGFKLYSEATDSTRGKSLRPQLFHRSHRGVISCWHFNVLGGQSPIAASRFHGTTFSTPLAPAAATRRATNEDPEIG
jgi:hypothetical protein